MLFLSAIEDRGVCTPIVEDWTLEGFSGMGVLEEFSGCLSEFIVVRGVNLWKLRGACIFIDRLLGNLTRSHVRYGAFVDEVIHPFSRRGVFVFRLRRARGDLTLMRCNGICVEKSFLYASRCFFLRVCEEGSSRSDST
jgi:hypothetical protein